ncbi:MAG: hypothetical protein AB1705_23175 [Verrucomicrobiota bacterium]
MSLKALHIVFVTASTLLAFGCAAWAFHQYYSLEAGKAYLAGGIGSVVAGLALIVYGRYFLKKLKNVSYL